MLNIWIVTLWFFHVTLTPNGDKSHDKLINSKNTINDKFDLDIRNITDEYDSAIEWFKNVTLQLQYEKEKEHFTKLKNVYRSKFEKLSKLDPFLSKAKDVNATKCDAKRDKRLQGLDDFAFGSTEACYVQLHTREIQTVIDIEQRKRFLLEKFKTLKEELDKCSIVDELSLDEPYECVNAVAKKVNAAVTRDKKLLTAVDGAVLELSKKVGSSFVRRCAMNRLRASIRATFPVVDEANECIMRIEKMTKP